MKTNSLTLFVVAGFLLTVTNGFAQTVERTAAAISSRGPNHRVWEWTEHEHSASGSDVYRTNSFTELKSGMHYFDAGEWKETVEAFEITPEGYAIARRGPTKVVISPVLNDAEGAVDLETADGALDTTFTPDAPNGTVRAVAVQPDGKVLIGGDFTTVGSNPRNRIARLNVNGTLDTDFNPGSGVGDETINAIAAQSDGKVLIGGTFTGVNGSGRNRIARLNSLFVAACVLLPVSFPSQTVAQTAEISRVGQCPGYPRGQVGRVQATQPMQPLALLAYR